MNVSIVCLISGSLLMAACKENTAGAGAGDAELQAKLQSAKKEQKSLQEELTRLQSSTREKRAEIEAAKKEHEERLVELQRKLREEKKEREALEAEFNAYKEEYKVSIRQQAKGIELGNLTLSSGPSYTGVVVSKWTPTALRVTHSGGNATLPFEDLPEPVQTMFVYDKAESEELVAKGDEAVTTGKPSKSGALASNEPWPTHDHNGPGPLVFTEPENTGLLNAEAKTRLDKAIDAYRQAYLAGRGKGEPARQADCRCRCERQQGRPKIR